MQNDIEKIQQAAKGLNPKVALVLGSGLGSLADKLQDPRILTYDQLDSFPQSTVVGHAGRLVMGTLNGVDLICMQGRHHSYEGHPISDIAKPIRAFKTAGIEKLILTNAAGSLRTNAGPGSLMLITDHINWAGMNPLIGPNDEAIGPRFFDMTNAYDRDLRAIVQDTAAAQGITLHSGTYIMYSGPNFETPAEIQAFARLGADAVGMSTVPECLAAVHCGMRVVAISSLVNLAAGMSATPITHDETLHFGAIAAKNLGRLIENALPGIVGA